MFEQPIPTLRRDGGSSMSPTRPCCPSAPRPSRCAPLPRPRARSAAMRVRSAPDRRHHDLGGARARRRGRRRHARARAHHPQLPPAHRSEPHWRSSACASRCSHCSRATHRVRAAWAADPRRSRRRHHATCDAIGRHGVRLIREIAARRPGPVRLMTHLQRRLARHLRRRHRTRAGVLRRRPRVSRSRSPVGERPRNQGLLTAWELRAMACRTSSSPTTPPACC